MGTHFFSPANVMKLLENVRGSHTSDLTIASMMAWGKQIGKWCILVGNCPGFVGNRMVNFYGGQARVMLEEGLMPEEVDGAATNFGMRVGPLAMSDIVGLDLGIQAWKKAGTYSPQTVIQHALIESGRLGQKTGKGFFDYDPKTRRASPSPEAAGLIQAVRAKNGAASLPHTLPFEGLGWGLPPPAMQHICSGNESEGGCDRLDVNHRATRHTPEGHLGGSRHAAPAVPDDQRGLQDPGGGDGAAPCRHRRVLCAWLLLPSPPRRPDVLRRPGAGTEGDNGIDPNQNWLRFTYLVIFSRSHHHISPPAPVQVGLATVKSVLESIGVKPAPLLAECVEKDLPLAKLWAAKTQAKL
jgi:hypothetical protein